MTSIVVVSHSHKIAEGVKQLINQMTDGGVDLIAVGGLVTMKSVHHLIKSSL